MKNRADWILLIEKERELGEDPKVLEYFRILCLEQKMVIEEIEEDDTLTDAEKEVLYVQQFTEDGIGLAVKIAEQDDDGELEAYAEKYIDMTAEHDMRTEIGAFMHKFYGLDS